MDQLLSPQLDCTSIIPLGIISSAPRDISISIDKDSNMKEVAVRCTLCKYSVVAARVPHASQLLREPVRAGCYRREDPAG